MHIERDRESKRAREREREREKGTWRGNTRTPAVGHHPRQGRVTSARTPERTEMRERERERAREREREKDVSIFFIVGILL